MEPSPYLPTSRRFVNPLYLRVEAIPEFADVAAAQASLRKALAASPKHARHVGSDRPRRGVEGETRCARDCLPRRTVRRPRAGLRGLPRTRRPQPRRLRDLVRAGRERTDRLASAGPKNCTIPSGTAVAGFAAKHADAVDFHRWLQWQLDDQLTDRAVDRSAGGHGTRRSCTISPSASTRTAPTRGRCRMCSRSASPRAHRPTSSTSSVRTGRSRRGGPTSSCEQGYEPFRALVNAMLRHAGGVRVDHIIGLFRLWWIPKGALPTEGTYVRYDHEAMIGIVALEAHRAGAVVVGEDLGTVEPWVRDYLRERGLLGTSILWFELDRDGGRRTAGRRALARVLPVVGHHPRPAADRGLPGRRACPAARRARVVDPTGRGGTGRRPVRAVGMGRRTAACRACLAREPGVDDIVLGLYRYLGRTPSRLLGAFACRRGRRHAHPEPAGHDGRIPQLACPAGGPDGRRLLLEEVFGDPRAASLCEALRAAVNTQV